MRIATRASALALAQARAVAAALPGETEIVEVTTAGDLGAAPGSDKSRWVAELERAVLDGEADVAVHSAKDVPGTLAAGLDIVAVPVRADARDALCGAASLDALPAGARVGTRSLRRRALLLAARTDLDIVPLGGNVDTRLRKLDDGAADALVLAHAGLQRLGRTDEAGAVLDPESFVPAPGQGALALEARAGDDGARAALATLNDPGAATCLAAERALAADLGGSCHTPIGAHAAPVAGGRLCLHAFVGLPDGSAWVRDVLEGSAAEPERLGRDAAARLLAAGARELLDAAEAEAA
ncbi:MAG: hydroxymethylbilane synthase [Solirubrobacteraceae bacterium]|nr:hydroxymethylbilane synthase [Solirubrobacteraceae bacterium]MDX6674818.1 hydroxymethylbilane synthase [Solirubrobacteraceae bacterium]